jgi:tetratricopeptide (TPR) repeat protein
MASPADMEAMRAKAQHTAELSTMTADELQDRIAEGKARDAEAKRKEQELEEERKLAMAAVAAAVAAGKRAFAAGDFAEAESKFDFALESNVENRHELICNRAACALKLGKFADAVADAAEATYLEPTYVKGHFRLACAQAGLGKFDRALKACRAGLALQPESAQLLALETRLGKQLEEAKANGSFEAESSAHGAKAAPASIVDIADSDSTQDPLADMARRQALKDVEAARKAKVKAELQSMLGQGYAAAEAQRAELGREEAAYKPAYIY